MGGILSEPRSDQTGRAGVDPAHCVVSGWWWPWYGGYLAPDQVTPSPYPPPGHPPPWWHNVPVTAWPMTNWPHAPGTRIAVESSRQIEEVDDANFVVLNIWVVQWPEVFHSRLLIIFRDFKLWRESHHLVMMPSVQKPETGAEWGPTMIIRTSGVTRQLKQIRNLFKRPMIHSNFGTIEQLFDFCRRGLI